MIIGTISAVLGIILFVDTSAQRQADPKFDELLAKIVKASEALSYEAVITSEYPANTVSKRTRKSIRTPDKLWRQTIEPDSLKRYVYIEKDSIAYWVDTRDNSVNAGLANSRSEFIEADKIVYIRKNYRAIFQGEETIQGRMVDIVKIESRARPRLWVTLWVDRENGFIYKFERYDENDTLVYAQTVIDVTFDPVIDPNTFAVSYSGERPENQPRRDITNYDGFKELQEDCTFKVLSPRLIPATTRECQHTSPMGLTRQPLSIH